MVLTPDATAPDGLAAALHGDLAVILTQAMAPERERRPPPKRGGNPARNGRFRESTIGGCGGAQPS